MKNPGGPGRRELVVALVLFAATLTSCVFTYAFLFAEGGSTAFSALRLRQGVAFGCSLMGILLAHEMGHYVVARLHGFALSLPWFIPFPNLFGTLGAVIRLRSLPRSRQALLEMGAAGPLAGGLVAFVLLYVSLPWASPAPDLPDGATVLLFQDPLLVQLVGILHTGAPPDPFATYHPVTMAGWVGCFLTGLNMLPVGQLDGGHILNALSPGVARVASRVVPVLLLFGGYWWPGWAVLGLLLLFLAAGRPLPVESSAALPVRSLVVAACAAVLFALTFLPTPVVEATLGAVP